MSRSIKATIAGALLLLVGWYAASPYITLHQMRSAAENKNAEELSKHIDFPAVKESLKASFSAKMVAEAAKSPDDNPFAGAGAALAIAMIGPMIDALITPQTIAMMMQGEKPTVQQADTTTLSTPSKEPNVSSGYTGLNTFEVDISDKDDPSVKIGLRFKRHGLFSWKLTEIDMPM
jgi:hypothetical protein